ncbi:MAG: tRNA 2-thiouridine(34) synthase MnmA [Deltaproteobacteria bacterium RIFOXYA12_FULL_58_15]|nr:MAG: tRNA 2-thiouridine(34) synthase MnmA [Deltaproteobacteria bacterium RIFOXYA12_FULL_58_15]OGR13344.1 MAG: tRNA 2-thiouridine(34) synthase MnmA [Deltaproteobacteria bacterium RIFOXYB12_FULL_58_9]
MSKKSRIAVGLSGGVDSAVAASLLCDAGHDVVGVIMTIWDGRAMATEAHRHACYGPGEKQDVEDARGVADKLGIPFVVVDLADAYNTQILDPCRDAYAAGLTPNPCVHCNAAMKFGLIPQRLRDCGEQVDGFATGHYALVEKDEERGRWLLKKGKDPRKEQSYFLSRLTQEQLSTTVLPLGRMEKSQVREIAAAHGFSVAEKEESQDFAAGGYQSLFCGDARPGPIVDQDGRELGQHQGIEYFTIGQRRGLGIAHSQRLYVTGLDPEQNAVVVGPVEKLIGTELTAGRLNWISIDGLTGPMSVEAKIRYRHSGSRATAEPCGEDRVRVRFDEPQQAITPGQAVVLYDGDSVVCGGVIER